MTGQGTGPGSPEAAPARAVGPLAGARWPTAGISYGGDYNPEQWPEEVWAEDVRLMRAAGVNLVTVGVFSWGRLEPEEGRLETDWLDRVLDLLHGAGIGVDLATPSAAPPMWLHLKHPEILPVDREGRRYTQGSRETWCPSSPVVRAHAVRIARALAERYGDHPAVRMWHVSNELGCHNGRCYCDVSAAAFRRWLRERYGAVEALNEAWGTAFWGQQYASFEQVLPPRRSTAFSNPGHRLDYERFSSDELVAHLAAEVAVLREVTPHLPVTTNFVVMGDFRDVDYARAVPHLDLVSNDHYLRAEDPERWRDLAFSADRVRGLADGGPWLLMEHSTGAVNWQPRNLAKEPGEMVRNSLAHVARGADGVLFFQWRASRAGAEKYHSAMLPHAGADSEVFREVTRLGGLLARLAEVRGSVVVPARVALLWDQESWWAVEGDARPSADVRYLDQAHRFHRVLTDLGVPVDVLPAATAPARLERYDVVLVPTLHVAAPAVVAALEDVVRRGGHVVVTYLSGTVDENDRVVLGGYPGAFRDLLGVRAEEFAPLPAGGLVHLDDGGTGAVWSERTAVTTADVVASFVDGPAAGRPAVTRRRLGAGAAWYVATLLDVEATARLLRGVLADAGIEPAPGARPGLELVRRVSGERSWLFAINHTDVAVDVPVAGLDLVSGAAVHGCVVPAGGVAVVREARGDAGDQGP